jgi:hypothetical protein
MSSALKIIKNGIELKKLWPLKIEGSRIRKNKPPNATKAGSQIVTKLFICCFVVIIVQK